jgi:hypothetical protein
MEYDYHLLNSYLPIINNHLSISFDVIRRTDSSVTQYFLQFRSSYKILSALLFPYPSSVSSVIKTFISYIHRPVMSRESVVGIVTWTPTEGSEFKSLWGQEFSLLHVFQIPSGDDQASYPMGTGCSFPGVKWPEREADHSLKASEEVKRMWIYTSIPILLHGVVLTLP